MEAFARGFEVTGFYLNELDLLAPEVLQFLPGRTGRYPDMSHGGLSWSGVIADFNAPDTDSWIYHGFFEAPPRGYRCCPARPRPRPRTRRTCRPAGRECWTSSAQWSGTSGG